MLEVALAEYEEVCSQAADAGFIIYIIVYTVYTLQPVVSCWAVRIQYKLKSV